jgi:hypothetical protein
MTIISDESFKQKADLIKYLKSYNTKVITEKCTMERATVSGENKISTLLKLESRDPSYSTKIMDIIRRFKGIDSIEIT